MAEVSYYILKSTFILALCYSIYLIAFSGDKNFIFNRYYLLGSSIIAFIIPLISIPVTFFTPVNDPVFQQAIELPGVIISEIKSNNHGSSLDFNALLLSVYLSGVLVFSIRYVLRLIRIVVFIKKHYSKAEKASFYWIIPTSGLYPTSSFLNYLLLDNTNDIPNDEFQQVILHEETHIRQKHTFDILYLELIKIIFWFNPLVYLYKKSITEVHEFIADEEASNKGGIQKYIGLLAWQTLHSNQLILSNPFIKSQTIKRMKMLKSSKKRDVTWNLILTIPIMALLFYVFACESSNPSQDIEQDPSKVGRTTDAELGEVFTKVDQIPVPEGGMETFFRFVMQNLTYPAEARAAGTEGKVFVEFVVDKTGKICNVMVLKGIGQGCDAVATKVVEASPSWKPGEHKGEKVNVKMVLPITFKLDNKDGTPSPSKTSAKSKNDDKDVVVVGYRP